MTKRRNVQAVTTPDGEIMIVVFPKTLGKSARFYHYPSRASVVRLHRAIESLTHSGTWKTSPQVYSSDDGRWAYGWIAKPFSW